MHDHNVIMNVQVRFAFFDTSNTDVWMNVELNIDPLINSLRKVDNEMKEQKINFR